MNSTIADNSAQGGRAGFSGLPGSNGSGKSPDFVASTGSPGLPANGGGGGLDAHAGIVTLTDATVAYNDAFSGWGVPSSLLPWGSAVGAGIEVSSATVTLNNTLVALNFDDTVQTGTLGVVSPLDTTNPDDVTGTLASSSAHNLFGVGGSGGLKDSSGNQVDVSTPGIGPLASNGGPTQTVTLLRGSPALGAGSAKLAVLASSTGSSVSLTTDQRGPGYVRSVYGVTDIGEYEATDALSTLSLASATGTYGGSVTLTATLTSSGAPIAGQSVQFDITGPDSVVSATTNSQGVATATLPIGSLGAGTHANVILAVFAGSGGYAPSRSSGSLTVGKATLTVTANNIAIIHDQTGSLPAPSDTIIGFVNGDGASVVSGSPAFGARLPPRSPRRRTRSRCLSARSRRPTTPSRLLTARRPSSPMVPCRSSSPGRAPRSRHRSTARSWPTSRWSRRTCMATPSPAWS